MIPKGFTLSPPERPRLSDAAASRHARQLKVKVQRWAGRSLALVNLAELEALHAALVAAGPALGQAVSAGPRLLANVTNELARRGQEGAGRE